MFEQTFRMHHEHEHHERGFGHHGKCGERWERRFGPPGFGGRHGRHGWRRFEGGFGGGRERMFDAGDVKLVVLKLLSEQPSYGYQIMKTMEERLAGGYTPSAGVIYPTLTLLEEEGLTTATTENNKKVYAVTPEGLDYLKSEKRHIDEIFSRIEEAGRGFERGRSPEIMKAFMDLRSAVVARVSRQRVSAEQIRKITEAINAAAKTIDEL